MGGNAIEYVYRDGSRLTPWMLYVVGRLDADLFAAHKCHVFVTSGIRTNAEQTAIFLAKFRVQAFGNGPYGDVRWWRGRRYVRVVGGGTVAQPGTSNHEIQGSDAAVDIRDTGSDAGIMTATSARGKWIRQWCRDTGLMVAEGDSFAEGWHFKIPGIFRTPPADPAGSNSRPAPEEDDMFTDDDRRMLREAHEAAMWSKKRIGGSTNGATIAKALGDILAVAEWVKKRLGGTTVGKFQSVSDLLGRLVKKTDA